MARIELTAVTQWITEAAVRHGDALAAHLMVRLDISRRRACHLLAQLVERQWLVNAGTPRKPLHRAGPLRQVVKRYALAGLQEDLPWRRDFAPCFAPLFDARPEIATMAGHVFTELLNNAIDHSGGANVTVSLRQTPVQLQLLVSDDGLGLFERLARSFALDDPQLAMLELSKGKLTSSPDCHRGHGLFFCSRLADVFDIHANHCAFQSRSWSRRRWHARPPAARQGTSIYAAIGLETTRTLDDVLRAHSRDGGGYGLDRTRVAVHLLGSNRAPSDGVTLASRAEARRVAARLEAFGSAELDFSGVADIGHGFADELFRVFAQRNPQIELLPLAMSPRVAAMRASVV